MQPLRSQICRGPLTKAISGLRRRHHRHPNLKAASLETGETLKPPHSTQRRLLRTTSHPMENPQVTCHGSVIAAPGAVAKAVGHEDGLLGCRAATKQTDPWQSLGQILEGRHPAPARLNRMVIKWQQGMSDAALPDWLRCLPSKWGVPRGSDLKCCCRLCFQGVTALMNATAFPQHAASVQQSMQAMQGHRKLPWPSSLL